MDLTLNLGWLHVSITLGPDEDDGDDQTFSDLGSATERAGNDHDERAEMDVRRDVGFRAR